MSIITFHFLSNKNEIFDKLYKAVGSMSLVFSFLRPNFYFGNITQTMRDITYGYRSTRKAKMKHLSLK